MRKRTLLATILVALVAAGTLIMVVPGGTAGAQTSPPSAGAEDCMYPLDCEAMDYNPCCQATGCKQVLVDAKTCIDKSTLEAGTTTGQGAKNSLLTTTYYRMLRAGTCPSNFRLTSWGESRALPIGSSTVASTTTTGTIASTHLICPETLPDNATITQLVIYGYDNTANGYIYSCLYKSDDLSSGGTAIACVSSTTVGQTAWLSSLVSEAVDNVNNTYYVSSYVTPGQDIELKIYTVEVRYTTP
ncbi:MAG: hypothetical protein HY897_10520 [Deltaproteobacteria bacterium]|nr:hypothetical protein [Deltaproteobacteria bacterium]